MILLNGADIVQKVSARDRESFEKRTAAQYITTLVRQADQAGMIAVSGTGDVLMLAEEIKRMLIASLNTAKEKP